MQIETILLAVMAKLALGVDSNDTSIWQQQVILLNAETETTSDSMKWSACCANQAAPVARLAT